MQHIECGYQQYAWGKLGNSSKVAKMVGKGDDDTGRYAELWIGTHPSKPSKLQDSGKVLKDCLDESMLGKSSAEYVSRYGNDIPFLLKVLSVDKALSVQAHPEREHAKKLHAADPLHYPDPNHKPELVVALTPYRALCCFRSISEIAKHLASIPPLAALIKNHEEIQSAANESVSSADHVKSLLKRALESLYACPSDLVAKCIDEHVATLGADPKYDADGVFKMLSVQYPGDVGCWMVYLLNLVHLNPGDALFLGPNEPHSYLSGDSVEIMATSDNVVRAGLTPKFKDVSTLIEMLTYDTTSLKDSHTSNNKQPVQHYAPPQWCDEFMLTALRLGEKQTLASPVKLPSVALAVVTSGNGELCGEAVREGSTCVIPADVCLEGIQATAEGSGLTVFLASINGPEKSQAKL